MAPNLRFTKIHEEQDDLVPTEAIIKDTSSLTEAKKYEHKRQIVWRNVILMAALHLASLWAVYLMATRAMWQTNVFTFFLYVFSGYGITAGAHRLWSHRSYKAKLPLRIFLAFWNSVAFQNHIYEWARDHRVHHKYSETEADPHNATRGFFFAHVGWLLVRKHPAVIEKGRQLDLSDLMADPVVRIQKKYYLWTVLVACFILPTVIPVYFWGEQAYIAFYACAIFRYCWTLNMTWLVNSAAHLWGSHPYDKRISPTECLPTILGAVGEGFHNFHHTFPWDYATGELGWVLNLTTIFINFCALIGQAYDLKTTSKSMIRDRKQRTGDRPDQLGYHMFN